jgi:hypothetical protein
MQDETVGRVQTSDAWSGISDTGSSQNTANKKGTDQAPCWYVTGAPGTAIYRQPFGQSGHTNYADRAAAICRSADLGTRKALKVSFLI